MKTYISRLLNHLQSSPPKIPALVCHLENGKATRVFLNTRNI
jgi:hypothetical protein